jgi:hypothetical protein
MRKVIISTAALLFGVVAAVFSQVDSTRYINGLPVSEDDTVTGFPGTDLGPKTILQPMSREDLPARLVEVLEKKPQYNGWRDSTIYFEKNTGIYHVPIKYNDGVKVFGLNENGDPVTFSETDRARAEPK